MGMVDEGRQGITKLNGEEKMKAAMKCHENDMREIIWEKFQEHLDVMKTVSDTQPDNLLLFATMVLEAFQRNNKLLLMGNGGSAADAQHLAAEFVGRFQAERQALPAMALSTDTSILTALGNDYGYDTVFARQIAALAQAGMWWWESVPAETLRMLSRPYGWLERRVVERLG